MKQTAVPVDLQESSNNNNCILLFTTCLFHLPPRSPRIARFIPFLIHRHTRSSSFARLYQCSCILDELPAPSPFFTEYHCFQRFQSIELGIGETEAVSLGAACSIKHSSRSGTSLDRFPALRPWTSPGLVFVGPLDHRSLCITLPELFLLRSKLVVAARR